MTNHHDYVQETNKKAELDLIKKYLAKLETTSPELNDRSRVALKEGLERLFYVVEQSAFNPQIARKIRIRNKLTLTELAKRLTSTKQHLSHYESGKLPQIKKVREGKNPHAYNYLNWLKENNYDPFNLTNK